MVKVGNSGKCRSVSFFQAINRFSFTFWYIYMTQAKLSASRFEGDHLNVSPPSYHTHSNANADNEYDTLPASPLPKNPTSSQRPQLAAQPNVTKKRFKSLVEGDASNSNHLNIPSPSKKAVVADAGADFKPTEISRQGYVAVVISGMQADSSPISTLLIFYY